MPKHRVTLSVEKEAVERAKKLGVNISKVLEEALMKLPAGIEGEFATETVVSGMKEKKEEAVEVKVVKAVEVEPEEECTIEVNIPKSLLNEIDNAVQLYAINRTRFISDALKEHLENMIGTKRLQELLETEHYPIVREKYSGVRYGRQRHIVDALIYLLPKRLRIYGLEESAVYLTPAHLQIIKGILEKEKTGLIDRKSKWIEFCEKTGLDPEKIPKDKAVKIVFETA